MPRSFKRLVLLLSAALLMAAAAASAPSANAESFGELGKPFFGEKAKEAFTEESSDHAFGVDSETNDVYVGDQPKENEYRIQEFSSEGKFLHAVSMKFEKKKRKGTEQVPEDGIEGIAVDPQENRVYALVRYERESEEGNGEEFVDPELPAAGTLFAFTASELKPATNTKSEGELEGVLDNTTMLHAQSEVVANPSESALIEPSGIAVDPTTHDVIILGKEEQCDPITTACEEHLLTAAQRIEPTGTLGRRWLDTGECFEGEGEGAASCFKETHKGETKQEEEEESALQPGEPDSPIVTASGRVLVDVQTSDEIWEIPKSFESGALAADAPKPLAVVSDEVPELKNALQQLVSFPGQPEPREGGALSYVHESGEGPGEGRLYQGTEVKGVIGKHANPGIAMLKLSEGGSASEVGWTGGQNKVEQEKVAGGGCWLSGFSQPTIGAGSKETVFALDPNVPPGSGEGSQEPPKPEVATFGPNGTRCPTASVAAPTATLNGTAVGTSANPAPAGKKVTLSSKLTLANALIVEWTLPEGAQKVTEPQFEATKLQYAFATPGEKTVTETIYTDNLAEPKLTVSGKIIVGAAETKSSEPEPEPKPNPPGNTGTSSTGSGSGGGSTPTTTSSVLGTTTAKGNPAAELAGTSLTVSSSGGFPVKVSCPAGETACTGTITLKTLTAVSASKGKKKAIMTLATGSFSVAGGATKSLTLRLSAAARKLLAHLHALRARATIAAHDSTGASHTTVATVTLKPAKKKSTHH